MQNTKFSPSKNLNPNAAPFSPRSNIQRKKATMMSSDSETTHAPPYTNFQEFVSKSRSASMSEAKSSASRSIADRDPGNLVPAFIVGSKRCFGIDFYVCMPINPSRYAGKMVLVRKFQRLPNNSGESQDSKNSKKAGPQEAGPQVNIQLNLPKNQCYIVENSLKPIEPYRDYYREHYNANLSANFSNWISLDYINPRLYVCQKSNTKSNMANLNQFFEHQMCHFNYILNEVATKSKEKQDNFGFGNLMHVKFSKVGISDNTTNLYFSDKKSGTTFVCNTIPVEISGMTKTDFEKKGELSKFRKVLIYHGGPKYSSTDVDYDYPTKYFRPIFKPCGEKIFTILRHKKVTGGNEVLYSIVAEYNQ